MIFDIYGGVAKEGSELADSSDVSGLGTIISFKLASITGGELKSLTLQELQPAKEYMASTKLPLEGKHEQRGFKESDEGKEWSVLSGSHILMVFGCISRIPHGDDW